MRIKAEYMGKKDLSIGDLQLSSVFPFCFIDLELGINDNEEPVIRVFISKKNCDTIQLVEYTSFKKLIKNFRFL